MIAENIVVKGVVRSSDGCQAHYVASDPRASYTLIDPATSLQSYNPSCIDWVSPHHADYNLLPPEHLKEHYKDTSVGSRGLPLSFLQVKTVEEGTEWYKATTKYPDEVCEILAKYEWGGLRYTTKKEFKNMKKKAGKKAEKQRTMQRVHHNEPILLRFD